MPRLIYSLFRFALCLALGLSRTVLAQNEVIRQVGVAKIDVTPNFPVRLMGYYGRNAEATNAAQHIFGKALAIGTDKERPAVLITLDNCILPLAVRNEILRRLQKHVSIDSDHFAICVSHNHSSPCLSGAAPNLFGMDIPASDQARIDRYTRELIEKLEKVSLAALKDRRPSTMAWGQTRATFAANRRTEGGPVDDDLPFLTVTDQRGNLRAILGNYACHCTTIGGDFKQIAGDWAGYAQDYLQEDHPGAIVLTAIGCGADANPSPRGTLELAKQHGREFADAVNHALQRTQFPLRGALQCRGKEIELPLDTPLTRAEWEDLAKKPAAIGYHARKNLARLDRGEKLETEIPYLVQTWNFGGDMAMVFLTGEVVVDYSLRLKTEFDSARLWINAYANSVPGYIPSRRILKEGGYEGGGAMVYYDHPVRFAPAIEDMIIGAAHELIPAVFSIDEHKAQFPDPKSPRDSLAEMQTDAGLKIELVASEPLIESPVAIDWGADGKLWVAEMRDYPMGMDNKWKPGGVIKYLEASHPGGPYDKATIVVTNVPYPTGVMPWHNGALVCAAPNIFYTEKQRDPAKGQIEKMILTGFFTENYQARVNGLSLGLDNWIYGANGLLGGTIHGRAGGQEVDIRGRDFRMHPDTGEFEPVAGLTQQGRARDDWGNWFGCDNSNPLWNYPLADEYVRRNPWVTAPSPRVYAATGPSPNLVYPTSRLLERFNEPNSANHITSGCGLGINRDNFLGPAYEGNAFVCEPVADVVYRLQLQEDEYGAMVKGARAPNEQDSEFLSSRDNWCRPVQSRLGPDGAIYIVDMYRFVIEHPDWISKERLAQLDIRAGAKMGRIYRIYPEGKKLKPISNLRKLTTGQLAAALDTPNGIERDQVHLELLRRDDASAVAPLSALARNSKWPAARIQAMCVLEGLKALPEELVAAGLQDRDAHVRRQSIRLSEPRLATSPVLQQLVLKLVDDRAVRFQLALSLGAWNDPRAGEALGRIASASMTYGWIRAAVLSSAAPQTARILKAALTVPVGTHGRNDMVDQLIATAAGPENPTMMGEVLAAIAPAAGEPIAEWQFPVLKTLLDSLVRKKMTLASFSAAADAPMREIIMRLQPIFAAARRMAGDAAAAEGSREIAAQMLGHDPSHEEEDLRLLGALLQPSKPLPVQQAALEALKHNNSREVPALLLTDWKQLSPSLRAPILEILLSREEFTRALLAAVQHRVVQPSEISAANRQRLLQNPNLALQKQAAAILQTGAGSSRAEVLARYAGISVLTGDPVKGKAHFIRNCTPCHFLNGQGNNVGPNLAALKDKTPGDFVLAIMDPSAGIEPRFIAYNIDTKDDRSLTGIISGETSTSLLLTQAGGIKETILRKDVAAIKANRLSLMPEGFETALNQQDLADLIAYLKQR